MEACASTDTSLATKVAQFFLNNQGFIQKYQWILA